MVDKQPGEGMPGKARRVEYYRLWGGDSGTWDTDFIDIPADTPDGMTDRAIRSAATKIKWRDGPPVIVGNYCDADEAEYEDDGCQQAVDDLLAEAKAAGLEAEDLEETVHELASSIAADVNNSGLEGQLTYLIEQLGIQEAGKELGRLAAERSSATDQDRT